MLRRFALSFLIAALLVPTAGATWSIVVVNRLTGEVAIGTATCLANTNLIRGIPMIVNGVGGGVIQSSGNPGDRPFMAAAMRQGLPAADVLEIVLGVETSVPDLQTGIVTMVGSPVTFSGSFVSAAQLGVVGEVGDLAYAIQGNVLAGAEVVRQAERALLDAEGDMGQRLLAGMIAARQYGGDGRCSCSLENFGKNADDCGSPPESFQKSAHSGYLLVARIGDRQAACVQPSGRDCANVPYHLRLNVRGAESQVTDPDPIDQLAEKYVQWRAARSGRPDGLLSRVTQPPPLPADGRTRHTVTVRLIDIDGVPLNHGNVRLEVDSAVGNHSLATIEEIDNHGDGTYSIVIVSADREATDVFAIRAIDNLVTATLYPFLEVRSEERTGIFVGASSVSARAGAVVPLTLHAPAHPFSNYLILGSLAGEATGITIVGRLDARGRGEGTFHASSGLLRDWVGERMEWTAVLFGAEVSVTRRAAFVILP